MLKNMENCKKYKSSINKTEKIRVNCATEHRERRKKRRTQDFDKPRNLSPTQEGKSMKSSAIVMRFLVQYGVVDIEFIILKN